MRSSYIQKMYGVVSMNIDREEKIRNSRPENRVELKNKEKHMCIRINLFMNHSLLTLDGFFSFHSFSGQIQCNTASHIARSCARPLDFLQPLLVAVPPLFVLRLSSTHKNSFSIFFFLFQHETRTKCEYISALWIFLLFCSIQFMIFAVLFPMPTC